MGGERLWRAWVEPAGGSRGGLGGGGAAKWTEWERGAAASGGARGTAGLARSEAVVATATAPVVRSDMQSSLVARGHRGSEASM